MSIDAYIDATLLKRPRVWDCARWALGAMALVEPGVAGDLLARWPQYASHREGARAYAERHIDCAYSYQDWLLDFAGGGLQSVVDARPGDLALGCPMTVNGVGYPAMGIVSERGCAWLLMRGGLTWDTTRADCHVGVRR